MQAVPLQSLPAPMFEAAPARSRPPDRPDTPEPRSADRATRADADNERFADLLRQRDDPASDHRAGPSEARRGETQTRERADTDTAPHAAGEPTGKPISAPDGARDGDRDGGLADSADKAPSFTPGLGPAAQAATGTMNPRAAVGTATSAGAPALVGIASATAAAGAPANPIAMAAAPPPSATLAPGSGAAAGLTVPATPAGPASAATPALPGSPATPAIPATPATPATPAIPAGSLASTPASPVTMSIAPFADGPQQRQRALPPPHAVAARLAGVASGPAKAVTGAGHPLAAAAAANAPTGTSLPIAQNPGQALATPAAAPAAAVAVPLAPDGMPLADAGLAGTGGSTAAASASGTGSGIDTNANLASARAAAPHQAAGNMQGPAIQVGLQMAKALEAGMHRISVRLSPAELGQVDVKLQVAADGKVMAVVTAERQEALDQLQRDSRGLEKALADAGLKSDSGSLNFQLKHDGAGTAERDSGTDATRTNEDDDDEANAVAANELPSLRPLRALDISV